MPVVTTQKYHTHNAKQFVESLTEGFRTYGSNTIFASANSKVLTISGNVFSTMRVGDILVVNNESRLITNLATNGTSVSVNAAFSTAITPQLFKTRDPLAAYDTYYVFIGRSTPWANSDVQPETPTDSVKEMAYDDLRDVLALQRITDNDLIYVVPRHTWANGAKYLMYDHRTSVDTILSNTTYFPYVLTSSNDVFKCVFNGRSSSNDASIPASISEPTITGVASPSDIVTSAAEDEKFYRWKYLYTLSTEDIQKYLTGTYMPVHDVSDVLDPATGDVLPDLSAAYHVFNNARSTGNGAIYEVVVENGGANYNPDAPPSVIIEGDGAGALATAQLRGNSIISITMQSYGQNYSFANVSIVTSNSGSGASATAIISPRNTFANTSGLHYISNHAISNKDELYAKHVMLYVELAGTEGGNITVENEYRRIGILKNPLLVNGEVATANVYDMTTHLTVSTADTFNKDEIVYQPTTGAYGVVVEYAAPVLKLAHVSQIPFSADVPDTTIRGIGNGNTAAVVLASAGLVPSSLPEMFADVVQQSGAIATVSSVAAPAIARLTGEILYVNNVNPVVRGNNQTEVIRTILTF